MHQTKKNGHSFPRALQFKGSRQKHLAARAWNMKQVRRKVSAHTHLLYQFVALLQLQGSVLQGGGGSVVDLQPLLI